MGAVVVFGSVNRDLVVTTKHLPIPGETVSGLDFQEFPGGKGANQAVAAARMGAKTALIGALGIDANGAAMRSFLDGEGIDLSALSSLPDIPTGVALITVDAQAENSIVVVPGANARVDAAMLPKTLLRDGDCLLAQFEVPLEATASVFRMARAAGAFTMLNPAPMQPVSEGLLALTDFLVLNETELAALTGAGAIADAAAAGAAIRTLHARGNAHLTVIATLGPEGCLALGPSGQVRIAGERVTAIDTTGAGDCFTGTLAAGLAQAMPFDQALARANHAAAISVTRRGAASSMPYLREI